MKKFIKDEMNIKDIINPVELNNVLYDGSIPIGNVIELTYDGSSILDLAELPGLNHFDNEYIVLAITEEDGGTRNIYLKQIPMN